MVQNRLQKQVKNIHKSFDILDTNDVFPFGKYKGYTILGVLVVDPSYIIWANEHTQLKMKTRIMEAAHAMHKKYGSGDRRFKE
jgi:hypothetical protein